MGKIPLSNKLNEGIMLKSGTIMRGARKDSYVEDISKPY